MDRKLSSSSIKGYRAMLSTVFRHKGLDISNDKDLSDLIRSFETSKNSRERLVSWNLDVVFKWLVGSKFEPLSSCSFRDLTRKTIFLVALATARRVSELHALDKRIGFSRGKAVCSSLLSFLAKNETPSKPWPRSFSIPGLSDLVGPDEEERLLCPVRALKVYFERTQAVRGPSPNLWCSVRDPSRPLSKNALSFFLRDLIVEAHNQVEDVQLQISKVKAHEVRAVSTSLAYRRNLSLDSIIQATFWKCRSVFASHYLREIETIYDGCSTLGPFVVTGTVLGKGIKEVDPSL